MLPAPPVIRIFRVINYALPSDGPVGACASGLKAPRVNSGYYQKTG
jgi:hypothetical protein